MYAAAFEYDHKYALGTRVLWMDRIWTVCGVQMSRANVLYYTLERVLDGTADVTRVRVYEDEIRDPNP